MSSLNVAVGGSGTPIVLLHGFPQTHLMWRHVAADLAADHTVICPDLRGYGASDKPAASDYPKRTMAADIVAVARALGHTTFALAGHDRGALVAFRAGLDHPDVITHLMCLDVLPTLDMWDVMHGPSAAVGFHLFLMAQPPGLAETMIAASADTFFGHFLTPGRRTPRRSRPTSAPPTWTRAGAAVPSIVADYRASATIDVAQDQEDLAAGNKLRMPDERDPAGLGRGPRLRRRRPCGAPGRPTCTTGRRPPATSWPRSPRPRSPRPSATY